MNKVVLWLFPVLLVLNLSACVSESLTVKSVPEVNYERLGIVVTGGDNLKLSRETRFAWAKPLVVYGATDEGRSLIFMRMINSELTRKGFKVLAEANNVDYLLEGQAVLGEMPAEAEIQNNAGLASGSNQSEVGSLSLAITTLYGRVEWTASGQVFTSDELSEQYKIARTENAIRTMLEDVRPAIAPDRDVSLCRKRSQVCSQDYRPVCALRNDRSYSDYANGCMACADPKVFSHQAGKCRRH